MELAGTAAKPLRAATLCIEGGETTAVQIGQDGYAFTAAFVVENSGSYWLDLIDRDGLRGGSDDRWEVRAMPDTPPTVNVEQPTADLFVTPRAVVPIRVSARDDLAIHRISLVFRQSDSEPEASMPLWTAAERPHPSALAEGARTTEGDRRVVDYPWDLGPLKLKAGSQLTFYAAASDYRPQTGKSEPLRLSVITPEEMQERIADREKLVLAELERALKMQRACRSQVAAITTRVAELPSLAQTDVDGLRAAQNSRHDASRVLAGRSEGVPMHVLALLADLETTALTAWTCSSGCRPCWRRLTGSNGNTCRLSSGNSLPP